MSSESPDTTYVTNDLIEVTWVGSNPTLVVRAYNGSTSTTEVTNFALLHLVEYALQPRSIAEIETELVREAGVTEEIAAELFTTAIDADILLTEEDAVVQDEQTVDWYEKNWRRGLLFYLFSYASEKPEGDRRTTRTSVQQEPTIGGRQQLPETGDTMDVSLRRALLERRSHRDFNSETLSLNTVARLLDTVTTPIEGEGEPDTDADEVAIRSFTRHAVSASAITFIASRVDGLDSGVYRYLPETHEIGTIKSLESAEAADELVQALANGQEFGLGSGATFLPSFRYPTYLESTEDWRHDWTGYQALSTVAQRILMAATANGLQTWMTVAIEESEADATASIEWPEEAVQSLISVGHADTTRKDT